jgi:beta-N-acetylhexosaminidase
VPLACVFGCAGPRLEPDEAAFFAAARPFGFILFERNVETPAQVRSLIAALRAAAGHPGAMVFIDQEGGRVRRLRPPHWPDYPPAAAFLPAARGDLEDAALLARAAARLIAHDLAALGVTANCAPVLDVPQTDAHPVLAGRAFAADPEAAARLGRAFAEGLLAGGVLPVVKHAPGHGRARVDSHKALPRVEADRTALEADFRPFRALSDMPMAMTAHVLYSALDAARPATTSRRLTKLIRRDLGFEGLLMTDDLSMGALEGDLDARAAAAHAAGCDIVLHCNGDPAEMAAVAAGSRPLRGRAAGRARAALGRRLAAPEPLDAEKLRRRLDAALAGAGL